MSKRRDKYHNHPRPFCGEDCPAYGNAIARYDKRYIEAEAAQGAAPRAEGMDEAIRAVTEYSWGLHLAGTPNEAEAISLIENLRRLSRPSDERVPESEEPR